MATSETPEALTWSVDLGADRPGKRLLVVAVALAAGLVGTLVVFSLVWALGLLLRRRGVTG